MTSKQITLSQNDKGIKEYILNYISLHEGLSFRVNEYKNITTIDVEGEHTCTDKLVKDMVCSSILLFYKYSGLVNLMQGKLSRFSFHAFIGALLSFDKDEERKIIMSNLEENSYSINTIFEFRLGKLKELWSGLFGLANRLLATCQSENDLFDLLRFVLSIEPPSLQKAVLEVSNKKLRLILDDIETPIPRLTDDEELNALMALIRERPLSITIANANGVSKELLDTIKAMA